MGMIDDKNCYDIASDYFHQAFFNQNTIHFKEKSFEKRTFMILNRSIYETIIITISWIYILLCLLEPGNRSLWPYNPDEGIYKFIISIECLIQATFAADTIIKTYIKFILARQKGWRHFFDIKHTLLIISTLLLHLDFVLSFVFYRYGVPFSRILRIFWAIRLILCSWKLVNFVKVLKMTFSYIFDITFLLIFIILLFAFVGWNFLEEV